MSTTGLMQFHFCGCTKFMFSFVQMLSDCSVGVLNLCMRKGFIVCFVSKTIRNICKEFVNMPHPPNIAAKCQV
jgi:hypothetical protein